MKSKKKTEKRWNKGDMNQLLLLSSLSHFWSREIKTLLLLLHILPKSFQSPVLFMINAVNTAAVNDDGDLTIFNVTLRDMLRYFSKALQPPTSPQMLQVFSFYVAPEELGSCWCDRQSRFIQSSDCPTNVMCVVCPTLVSYRFYNHSPLHRQCVMFHNSNYYYY